MTAGRNGHIASAAHQHSAGRERLAALRSQTPAKAQGLDVASLIRQSREQR